MSSIYADIWTCRFCKIGNDTPFCAKCGIHKCTAAERPKGGRLWNG